MSKTVKILGLPEMEAAIAAKVAELHAGAIEAVAAEVALVGSDVEDAVPVDTGELKDSVQRESGGLEGSVKATARHAKFVEFGTYKDPAQPYMGPAADKARRRFPATAAAIIRKALGV